jgi:hypothetical protein
LAQSKLARLKVGVIGSGSVGSIVLEGLARMGVQSVTVVDFDDVEEHNQDRCLHMRPSDVGLAKIDVIARELPDSATAARFDFNTILASVCEDVGYRAALDCDVLFSCVDRPWARAVLNFIAYAHLVPVIDGGIAVSRTPMRTMRSADWRAHTVGPGRRCLTCLGQYVPADVQTEREGRLDDSTYIEGLHDGHPLRANENVFAFSLAVGSLELLQLIALVIAPAGLGARWAQTFHYPVGVLDVDSRPCDAGCTFPTLLARGEAAGLPGTGHHHVADLVRARLEKRRTQR